jgi:two-component system, NarL family, nitrate/nitrite response regulator NarL
MTVALMSESRPGAEQPLSSSWSSSHSEERRRPVPTLIVDKSPLFRAGLEHILAASPFQVATSCSRLSELSEELLGDTPCVLLMSLYEEVPAVMQQLASLSERGLHIFVLAERFHPEELVAALTAGVSGYFLRNEVSYDVLVKALEIALLGEVVLMSKGLTKAKEWMQLQPDAVSGIRIPKTALASGQPQAANNAAQANNVHRLSDREETILERLMQGLSNKHIARQLNIAEATVKVHIKGILRKLGVINRTQAALWARDHVRPNEQSKPQPLVSSPAAGNTDGVSETIPGNET